MGDLEHEAFNDKIMKVATVDNPPQAVEVNISELARKISDAAENAVESYVNQMALPHFRCSIGIPNFRQLELNIENYFAHWNTLSVEQFSKLETEIIRNRIRSFADELGVEPPKFDWSESNKAALKLAEESKNIPETYRGAKQIG